MRVVLQVGARDARDDESRWALGQLLRVIGFSIGERPATPEPFILVSYGEEPGDVPEGTPVVVIPRRDRSDRDAGRLGDPVEVQDRRGETWLAFPPFDALPAGEALWRDRRGQVVACRVPSPAGTVRFAFDLVSPARRLLARREERPGPRDILDRYRPESSWMAEWDLFGEPVTDRLGAMLRGAIAEAIGAAGAATARVLPWPRAESFAITLTHDQDQSIEWMRRLARHGLQSLRGGAGGRAGGFRLFVRDVREGAVSPTLLSERVVRQEAEHGIRSTFFFLAVDRDRFARRYRVESPPFRRFLREIGERGFAVGLHGGLDTYRSADGLRIERATVTDALGREVFGVRQHYARLRIPETWWAQREAGFRYDASLGYPETPGFRAGTSFPFHPHEVEDFVVVPFHGMDRALVAEGVTNRGAWDIWSAPARRVGGLVDILWHPYFTDPDHGPEREHLFRGLLAWMEGWKDEAWIATLDEVAEWWSARRLISSAGAWRRDGRTYARYRFGAALPSAAFAPLPPESEIRIEEATGVIAELGVKGTNRIVAARNAAAGAELVVSVLPWTKEDRR